MSEILDTTTNPFIKAAVYVGLSVATSAFIASSAFAQQTAAETAAMTERPLTQDEIDQRLVECSLPSPSREAYMGDQVVAIAHFPEFRFLELLRFESGYQIGDQDKVLVHPELPYGGIGAADSCGEALFSSLSGDSASYLSLALMLRAELDLQESYPSSAEQILESGQLTSNKSSEYLVLPLPRGDILDAVEPVFETLTSISGVGFIDWTGQAFWMRNALFLPLKSEGADDE